MYTFRVQVSDIGGSTATATGTALVTSAGERLHLVVQPVAAVAGQAFTNVVVATFTDSNPNATPTDFTAAIDWGDGYNAVTTSSPPTAGGTSTSWARTTFHPRRRLVHL